MTLKKANIFIHAKTFRLIFLRTETENEKKLGLKEHEARKPNPVVY